MAAVLGGNFHLWQLSGQQLSCGSCSRSRLSGWQFLDGFCPDTREFPTTKLRFCGILAKGKKTQQPLAMKC